MIVRVDDDAGHEGCANGAFPGDLYSEFLPLPSLISRAIDPGRARAGKENIGINRSMVSDQIVGGWATNACMPIRQSNSLL